jgi:hypothetical protein
MNISNILAQGNWLFAHKTLIKKYDAETAIIVGYLCDKQTLFKKDWFYCVYEKIEEELGIKIYSIKKSIHALLYDNILLSKREGLPCRTYYQINEGVLLSIFEENNNPLVPPKTEGLEHEFSGGLNSEFSGGHNNKLKPINTKTNKTINKKNIQKKLIRTKKPLEKIPELYLPYKFFKDEFSKVWFNEFLPLKIKKKASTTERALKQQLNNIEKFSNGDYDTAFEILTKSVNSGWVDFYAPTKSFNNKPNTSNNNPMGTHHFTKNKIKYDEGIEIKN